MSTVTKPDTDASDAAVSDQPRPGTIRLDCIEEAGAYLCRWSGHLLRMTDQGVNLKNVPAISMLADKPLFVTKISDDPDVSLDEARTVAKEAKLFVDF